MQALVEHVFATFAAMCSCDCCTSPICRAWRVPWWQKCCLCKWLCSVRNRRETLVELLQNWQRAPGEPMEGDNRAYRHGKEIGDERMQHLPRVREDVGQHRLDHGAAQSRKATAQCRRLGGAASQLMLGTALARLPNPLPRAIADSRSPFLAGLPRHSCAMRSSTIRTMLTDGARPKMGKLRVCSAGVEHASLTFKTHLYWRRPTLHCARPEQGKYCLTVRPNTN